MQPSSAQIRRNAKTLAAILIVTGLFLGMRYSLSISEQEVSAAAARFRFSRTSLSEVVGPPIRYQRRMHPSLERISSFLSTLGAAVALNDIDGDGLSNDLCYIDTRTDQVIIAPVPENSKRYPAFALVQESTFFDRDRMAPLGVLLSDLNEDGHIDVIVYYAGRTPLIFLRSPAKKSYGPTLSAANYVSRDIFASRNPQVGGPLEMAKNDIWVTGSATTADLDGDGHLDLIFANYFQDGSDIYNPQGGGAVEMPRSFSHAANGGGERIYRWTGSSGGENPTVNYEQVHDALPAGVGGGWGLAVGACDLDGDLLPEVYVAHDFGPDRLFWNRSTPGHLRFDLLEGQKHFSMPKSYVLGNDSFKSMGVDFGDLNGDGIPDIYVSNITEPKGLQESQMVFVSTGETNRMREGVAPYINRGEALAVEHTGWAWDAKLDDFDNDGILELLQASGFVRGTSNRWPQLQELATANDELISNVNVSWPRIEQGADIAGYDQNPFFVRMGDRYVDVSREIGFGEQHVSRGIAIADVDADGSLDLVVSNMWGPATYYHNECPTAEAFLSLHILLPLTTGTADTVVREGHPSHDHRGRPAIGAVVTVTLPDGRTLTRQVDGGNGHSGKRSPDLHFGLGAIEGPVRVRIDFRDPGGGVRHELLSLKPGWYTVLTGWAKSGASSGAPL